MGQLEAELKAPDITPDMYEPNNPDDDNWKFWLRSLMQDDVGNEGECAAAPPTGHTSSSWSHLLERSFR